MTLPTLFISHGAPNMVLHPDATTDFLSQLPEQLGLGQLEFGQLGQMPRAILVVSAHWEASVPTISVMAVNSTIHDFGGFEPEMYKMNYPAPGDPALAMEIAALLSPFSAMVQKDRGLDHGAWVPLMMMWPKADVPVLQLSLAYGQSAAYHVAVGHALASLREQGVLILASGSFTHDLRGAFSAMRQGRKAGQEPHWVSQFSDWMTDKILAGDMKALENYLIDAPFARKNHPTDDHILPLFVAMGATMAGEEAVKASLLHSALTFDVLRLDAFRFD